MDTIRQMTDGRRFQLLVEAVTDFAIYMLDLEGYIVSWNSGANRLKRYTADQIIGKHFSTLYSEEDQKEGAPATALSIARNQGRFESVGWRVRQDGTRFWARAILETIKSEDGNLIGFAMITRDITERRDVLNALKESERQFRLLVSGVTDHALYMLDPNGIVVTWNSGAENIKGYQAAEIIGRYFSVFYNDEDRLADVPARALAVAKEQGKWQAEGWRNRKDGSVFWASEVIDAVRDEQGALIGFANVTRDITERRQARQTIDKSQEQLSYLKKMEALGRLTGSIAHNFNNLLMIVSGHAQTIKRLVKNDAKGLRAVDAIEVATKRGATLTRHMLGFSGRRQLNPETADLKSLVEGFGWLLNSLIVNIQLTIQIPQDLWPVEIDASELELALVNMVLNSREAMPQGGSITITAENVHLPDQESPKHLSGDFVALKIADTGSGIPPEVLAKVFDPFFTTKESNKSAGLGLSQVYGFAVQSHGAVRAKSETGKGTEITMHLPRTIAAPISVRSGEDSDVASAAGGLVLIVEDDTEVAEVTASLIDQLGYKCRVAIDAEGALQMFERGEKFDLVFSDVAMPGAMDGVGLAHALRRRYPGVPILLTSGLTTPNVAAEEGILLLRKPYGLDDLRRAINRVLSKSGAGSGAVDETNLVRFPNKQWPSSAAKPEIR
jgi:PAS domain S-box-containing protein